jgi:hypothetical protein
MKLGRRRCKSWTKGHNIREGDTEGVAASKEKSPALNLCPPNQGLTSGTTKEASITSLD